MKIMLKKIGYISFLYILLFNNIVKGNNIPDLDNIPLNNINKKTNQINNRIQEVYLLGPSDKLLIKLYKEIDQDFSGEYIILNDGTINMPFVESVYLKGLTIKQAKEKIEKRLSSELIRPEIYIKLVKSRASKISMLGELQNPGLYIINTSKTVQVSVGTFISKDFGFPTLIEAIKEAGGVSNGSNLREIKLTRKISEDPLITKEYNINLIDLLIKGDQAQNPYLFDGDIINIPKAEISYDEDQIKGLRTNLFPNNIEVNIVGEVIDPGLKKLNPNSKLNDAILMAGGPIFAKSSLGNVRLIRTNANGTVTFKKYRIDFSNQASDDKNPILKNQDTIIVYKNSLEKGSSVLSIISRPIRDFFSIYSFTKILED